MKTIAILEYGIGNRRSVSSAISVVGARPNITRDRQELDSSDGLIIPGVGAFPQCIAALKSADLVGVINEYIRSGRPVFGICVGMQMLFDQGTEFVVTNGLGIIPGQIERLAIDPALGRLPHVAWTALDPHPRLGSMFSGIPAEARFYFVHSFAPVGVPAEFVSGIATYGGRPFVAAVQKGSVWGTQFHPEKSGPNGLEILTNFVRGC